jgi:ubiquinone/menaquinone biosynthesis C-methylase UbiE
VVVDKKMDGGCDVEGTTKWQRCRDSTEQLGLDDQVEFTVADLADLPLPDRSVDLVVLTASLQDVGAVVASLDRVLQSDGRLCIATFARYRLVTCRPLPRSRAARQTGLSYGPAGSQPHSSSASRSWLQRRRSAFAHANACMQGWAVDSVDPLVNTYG